MTSVRETSARTGSARVPRHCADAVTWTRPISAWEGSGAVTASASGRRRRLLLRVVLDFQRKKETGEIGEAEMCNRPHRPTIIGKIDRGNRPSEHNTTRLSHHERQEGDRA